MECSEIQECVMVGDSGKFEKLIFGTHFCSFSNVWEHQKNFLAGFFDLFPRFEITSIFRTQFSSKIDQFSPKWSHFEQNITQIREGRQNGNRPIAFIIIVPVIAGSQSLNNYCCRGFLGEEDLALVTNSQKNIDILVR